MDGGRRGESDLKEEAEMSHQVSRRTVIQSAAALPLAAAGTAPPLPTVKLGKFEST
jgi:hypothetical protein